MITWLLLCPLPLSSMLRAEVVDRVAVALDRQVITASAIEEEVRVASFENREPVDLSPKSRRKAADRLIEQALVKREMLASHYSVPAGDQVEDAMEEIRKTRPEFEKDLVTYGLTEAILRRHVGDQLTVVRFIDDRFRPAVVVGDDEVQRYYDQQFVPDWKKRNGEKAPPAAEDAWADIAEILTQEKVDQALDQWLEEGKRQARIHYIEEAFQ